LRVKHVAPATPGAPARAATDRRRP